MQGVICLWWYWFFCLYFAFWPISAKLKHLRASTITSGHTCWCKSQVCPGGDERNGEANFDAERSDPRETSMLINEISRKAILL